MTRWITLLISKFPISYFIMCHKRCILSSCLTNTQSIEYICTNCKLTCSLWKYHWIIVRWFFRKKSYWTIFWRIQKKIGHRACLGDIMGQTYPIYACTSNNHQRHFISSQYIFLQLEPRVFKVPLEKNLIERKSRAYGTILYT